MLIEEIAETEASQFVDILQTRLKHAGVRHR